ncbi:MAG: hypothetical protein ACLPZR_20725 [Solirubrobacteraceae bacterium]
MTAIDRAFVILPQCYGAGRPLSLIDAMLPPRVAELLNAAEHDAMTPRPSLATLDFDSHER